MTLRTIALKYIKLIFEFLLSLSTRGGINLTKMVCNYNLTKFLPILQKYNIPIDRNYKGLHNLIKNGRLKCFMYLMDNGVELYEQCFIESIKSLNLTLINLMIEYDCPATIKVVYEARKTQNHKIYTTIYDYITKRYS